MQNIIELSYKTAWGPCRAEVKEAMLDMLRKAGLYYTLSQKQGDEIDNTFAEKIINLEII